MTGSIKDLIAYRMERAKETLEEARIMMEGSHLFGAANRLYYACYYAINAALIKDGLSASKHSGVRSLFNRCFVKTGKISIETGIVFNTLYDFRQISDYKDFHVVKIEAIEDLFPRAVNLISEIEKHLAEK